MSLHELHDVMYTNISLLTYVCPPNPDFKVVFKKDMFIKNNKTAFQQVVHYLLMVLNPSVTQQKFKYWPPMSIKEEVLFRNEVMAYVNELNKMYKDANIPVLMTSHLISPGGIKFVKFMLKLSELVLRQHLKKDAEISGSLLFPIHPSKSNEETNARIALLNTKTNYINKETQEIKIKFIDKMQELQKEADSLKNQQEEFKNILPTLTEKCEEMKKVIDELIPAQNVTKNTGNEKFDCIKTNLVYLQDCVNKMQIVSNLINNLQSNNILIESNSCGEEEDEKNHKLNLQDLLLKFQNLIEKNKLKFLFTGNKVKENIENAAIISNSLTEILNQYSKTDYLLENIDKYLGNNDLINYKIINNSNNTEDSFKTRKTSDDLSQDSILAVPLDTSYES